MSTAVADPDVDRDRLPRPLAVTAALPARIDAWLDARRGLTWALTVALLALVAIIAVVPPATSPAGISPIDEYVYTDAVDKADRGELTNTGDMTDEYSRQVMVCRGVTGLTPASRACGADQPDASLPLGGFTSADVHPPTYFFLTAWVAKVVRAVGLTDDLLISARLVGVLWLTLGLLAVVALGRAWGAGWLLPVLTAVAIGTSPLLVSVSAFISPDALGLLVGALSLLAITYWMRERLPTAVLVLAAVLPAFVKVPFVLAPLFGAVLLLVAGVIQQIPWRRALTGAVVLVAGAGAGSILWQELRGLLAVAVPIPHPDGPPASLKIFFQSFGYYMQSIPTTTGAPFPVPALLAVGILPLAWLLISAALGGMMFRRRNDPLLPVCWAGIAGMALGSMVLSLMVLVASGGAWLGGTPRYGLALLPLFALPLMCTRHAVAVLGLLASAGAGVLAHAMLW